MRRRWLLAPLLILGSAIGFWSFHSGGPAPSSKKGKASAEAPVVVPRGSSSPSGKGARAGRGAARRQKVEVPWGYGPTDLGHERPSEGSPSGPMSFAFGGDGSMWVLDQVNHRIVKVDPSGKRSVAMAASPVAQDLAVSDDGHVAVLDRFQGKDVSVFDAEGHPVGSLPLVGEGVEKPGLVTSVLVDGDDVYVEREHGPLVRIGKTDGTPADPREEIPGRPTRDGAAYILAGIVDAAEGRAYVASNARPSEDPLFTREIRFESEIHSIVLLDSDATGLIYFAAQVSQPEGEEIVLVCLEGGTGEAAGSATLPANTLAEETLRDLVVLDSGGVVLSLRTEEGVSYDTYYCES